MGLLINTTDFTGKYAIAQSDYTDLDLFISEYEESYLIDLLGATLFDLFKANYSPGPVSAPYDVICNPFHIDDKSCVRKSEGMKKMVLGFVYVKFVSRQSFKNTVAGLVTQKIDLGESANPFQAGVDNVYNDSVETYQQIQWYIINHKTDYPDYNGQLKSIMLPW